MTRASADEARRLVQGFCTGQKDSKQINFIFLKLLRKRKNLFEIKTTSSNVNGTNKMIREFDAQILGTFEKLNT
jgi:predicted transcriptional regulator